MRRQWTRGLHGKPVNMASSDVEPSCSSGPWLPLSLEQKLLMVISAAPLYDMNKFPEEILISQSLKSHWSRYSRVKVRVVNSLSCLNPSEVEAGLTHTFIQIKPPS